jgi:NAD(P)-dependent dehydrogenase (short-subunit alcohol dehydrogenase family)
MGVRGAIAVTGASRGIGSATARELAGRGFSVACLSRRGEGVEDAEVSSEAGARMSAYACDVTDGAAVIEALRRVVADAGALGGLVNNAGIHAEGPSQDFPMETFEQIMATNVTGTFAVSRAAFPWLLEAGGGTIVNIGSFYDRLGVRGNTAYCASKAAVGAITRCLAVEWARHDIRVLAVAPGYIETDLNREALATEKLQRYLARAIPVGRAGSAEEVGRLVGAIFAEDIPFLTAETIYLDGGQGVAG